MRPEIFLSVRLNADVLSMSNNLCRGLDGVVPALLEIRDLIGVAASPEGILQLGQAVRLGITGEFRDVSEQFVACDDGAG